MKLYEYNVKQKSRRNYGPLPEGHSYSGFIVAENKSHARSTLINLWFTREDQENHDFWDFKILLSRYDSDGMPLVPPPVIVMQEARAEFRHLKSGGIYELLGIGKLQATGWRYPTGPIENLWRSFGDCDMIEMALYRSKEDGTLWCRPLVEWQDGRFEEVS